MLLRLNKHGDFTIAQFVMVLSRILYTRFLMLLYHVMWMPLRLSTSGYALQHQLLEAS